MALKLYKADCILSFPITLNGRTKTIYFESYSMGGGYYTTDNEAEQEQIEKSNYFKQKRIIIKQSIENLPQSPAVKEIVKEDKRVVEGITKCSEAKDWIEQNLGIACGPVISRAKIFQIAEENNVEFPDLPKENKK